MSAATDRLIQGFFDCELLGEYNLRGVSQPLAIYRVLQASEPQSRLEAAGPRGLTPLVGRQAALHLLTEAWNQTQLGLGRVTLIHGEPGLGKSRLVQALKEQLTNASYTQLECRSSPYYQNKALYPIIDLFQRIMQWEMEATSESATATDHEPSGSSRPSQP